MLSGKNIIVGITGSIAAYKAAFLVRLLIKQGANVKVMMTSAAKEFIAPLTLSTLSKNPVIVDFINDQSGNWNNHVDTALWADLMVIAPATATTMSKMANGLSDNFLVTTYLSAKCSVMVCPAMDLDMYQHPSTKKNIETLKSYGNIIVEAKHGELASGLIGEGRMAEPEEIIEHIHAFFLDSQKLSGKKVLVTAGPTFEQLDPVRFIGNHSSGKMGYAIASQAKKMGAEVFLVSGPSSLEIDEVNRINVTSAKEMFEVVTDHFKDVDIVIMAAAVSDYKPKVVSPEKVKKSDDDLIIELERTKDILAELGKTKKPNQTLVGFAMETHNEENFAKEKLKKKNLDFIVLNKLNEDGAGFKADTNLITIFDKNNNTVKFELKSKQEVAKDILEYALKFQA
ncbi:MAG: bifunctional phosphopantothenoylcysteine decarboxylase/phosphopantothenate--cysteine ligase CoaBC [Bacteroidia bacterium]